MLLYKLPVKFLFILGFAQCMSSSWFDFWLKSQREEKVGIIIHHNLISGWCKEQWKREEVLMNELKELTQKNQRLIPAVL